MKFDFVIGNPPYQEASNGESLGANSVYDKFLDSAYQIADKVEMIHPARFLFNAGSTSKVWNRKMLNDEHLKICQYEPNSDRIFPSLATPIKGGIAITYRDSHKKFGEIGIFTPYSQLNYILHKIRNNTNFKSISEIAVSRTAYRLTDKMHKEHPEAIKQLSKGHAYDMSTNIFKRLPQIFYDVKPKDEKVYIRILGRNENTRLYKYIRRDYVNSVINLDKYKMFLAKANGVGSFGETLAKPIVGEPACGNTETFLSIGDFNTLDEAKNAIRYFQTKLARAMLGVLKVTQDITPEKFKYVPLQDFTDKSDIDWSKSVADIDKQLYKKYKLSKEEISFIETNVREMA